MSEQIMWAVREPDDGKLFAVHEHEAHCKRLFLGDQVSPMAEVETRFHERFGRYGYRTVRVSVSEYRRV